MTKKKDEGKGTFYWFLIGLVFAVVTALNEGEPHISFWFAILMAGGAGFNAGLIASNLPDPPAL